MDGETLKGCLMVRMDPRVAEGIDTFIWYGEVNGPWLSKNTTRLLFEQQSIKPGASGDQCPNAFLIGFRGVSKFP